MALALLLSVPVTMNDCILTADYQNRIRFAADAVVREKSKYFPDLEFIEEMQTSLKCLQTCSFYMNNMQKYHFATKFNKAVTYDCDAVEIEYTWWLKTEKALVSYYIPLIVISLAIGGLIGHYTNYFDWLI